MNFLCQHVLKTGPRKGQTCPTPSVENWHVEVDGLPPEVLAFCRKHAPYAEHKVLCPHCGAIIGVDCGNEYC